MSSTDTSFGGSIPANYDRFLGPLLFEPYARIAAERSRAPSPARILETAAGTGVVTEAVAAALPQTQILATDLERRLKDRECGDATVWLAQMSPASGLDGSA